MDLQFIKRCLRVATAGSLGLAISGSALAGPCCLCEKTRDHVSPVCHPTWGFHQTCWRRFPRLPPCECDAVCNENGEVADYAGQQVPATPRAGAPVYVAPNVGPSAPVVRMPPPTASGTDTDPAAPDPARASEPAATPPPPVGNAPMLPPEVVDPNESAPADATVPPVPNAPEQVVPDHLKPDLRNTPDTETDADSKTGPVGFRIPGQRRTDRNASAHRQFPVSATRTVTSAGPAYPVISPLPPGTSSPTPQSGPSARLLRPNLKKSATSPYRRAAQATRFPTPGKSLQVIPN